MTNNGNHLALIQKVCNYVHALRQSILKSAFTGQLVPQDPSHERATNSWPASAPNAGSHRRQNRAGRPALSAPAIARAGEEWDTPTMSTVTADQKRRVPLPGAQPGDVFDVQKSPDGKYILEKLVRHRRTR